MADRSVTANETFAEFRNTMNETMTDVGDITQLGNSFGGTPTDMVEACNQKASVAFAISMPVALG
tara:strand:- start:38 stop:232 length:195 start_codon:yes stop_codon:yes gene_type:complete